MNAIWKFPLDVGGCDIEIPQGARILRVDTQIIDRNGWAVTERIFIWAIVDTRASTEKRRFVVAGTGHPLPNNIDNYAYLGTFFMQDTKYVFHAFEAQR